MRYTANNNRRNAPEQVIVLKDQKVKKLVLSALMAALVYVATSIIQIPSPMSGYVNLGDCFVLLSGWLLGPWYGGAAAGIGSMLVDLLGVYAHYAPGTLVIKAVDAIARQPEAESKISKSLLLGCALAEATAVYGFVIGLLIIFFLG